MTRATIGGHMAAFLSLATLLQMLAFSVATPESSFNVEETSGSFLASTLRHLKGVTQGLTRQRRREPRSNKTKKLEMASLRRWCNEGQACDMKVNKRASAPVKHTQATARGVGMSEGTRGGWDDPFADYNMSMELPSQVSFTERACLFLFILE